MSENESQLARRESQVATKAPANKVRDLLLSDKAKAQFAMALPKHIKVDLLLRIALTAINKLPKLADCTQDTLFGSIMDLAQMGLVPDGRTAYLVPFWHSRSKTLRCQYIVGYQGFIDLAYRHPLVKGIRFNAVHEKDLFEYEDGLESKLIHRPTDDEDPGKLTHAWAVCELEGNGRTFVVLNRRQVMEAKASAQDADKAWSPWVEHEESMWAKTAVRALAKRMPRSAELTVAIQADDKQANEMAIDIGASILPGSIGAIGDGQGTTAIEDAAHQSQQPADGPKQPEQPEQPADPGAPTAEQLRAQVTASLAKLGVTKTKFIQQLHTDGVIPQVVPFGDLGADVLQGAVDGWDDLAEKLKP